MSRSIVRVSLLSVSPPAVESALRALLGTADEPLGVKLVVADVRDAHRVVDEFVEEQGLLDESLLADYEDVSVTVSAFAPSGSLGESVTPVLMDHAGRLLSEALSTTSIVDLLDGEHPFRVYEEGRCTKDYSGECRDVIARLCRWVPLL